LCPVRARPLVEWSSGPHGRADVLIAWLVAAASVGSKAREACVAFTTRQRRLLVDRVARSICARASASSASAVHLPVPYIPVIRTRVIQASYLHKALWGQNSYVKQKLRLVLPLTVSLVVIGGAVFVIWSVATASGQQQTNIATVWATVLTAIALVPPCCFGRGEPVSNLKVEVLSHESSEWLPPITSRSGR
jgi:hypothetical protein